MKIQLRFFFFTMQFITVVLPINSYSILTITQPVSTSFGTYSPLIQSYSPSLKPYSIPENLAGVLYSNNYNFSDTALALLEKNGFVATPSKAHAMTDIYRETTMSGLPVFVSTDALLHTFYKTYDNMLKIAEYNHFYGELDSLLQCLLNGIVSLRNYSKNDSLNIAITRTAAYLDVAHTLLTDTIFFKNDAEIRSMVVAETLLVKKHTGFKRSEVVPDLMEDYSQYVPRGHYILDSKFERYFKCMIYLSRIKLFSKSSVPTMMAGVLTRLLATSTINGKKAGNLWADIYNTTAFFAGRSDDLNYLQYAEVFDRVLGNKWRTDSIEIVLMKIDTLKTELLKLPPPLILSGLTSAPGFQFMGQRFVPDSYMFGQLVFQYVGTESKPRLFPSGLDLMTVLGSQRARQLQVEMFRQDTFSLYTKQLDFLITQFETKPASHWVDNLYWNWLYTLIPLLKPYDKGYPSFMTNQAWIDKSLVTASGSWAELRHASILYAKQSYTASVGIHCPLDVPFPQGYVEPNPDVFGRLASIVSLMKSGFVKTGISKLLPIDKLTNLLELCIFLHDMAIKELCGKKITIEEYCSIANTYKKLIEIENFSQYEIPPVTSHYEYNKDSSIACIIDVHTDPNSGQVLEAGVGNPMCLYVVVPVEGKL